MAFKDLDEWFDSSLQLPIKGTTYRIESVDAATGVWCQRLMTVATKSENGDVSEDDVASLNLDDDEEREFYARIMGDAYAQMIADNLPWEWIKHAGTTTLMWITNGTEVAETFWNAGGVSPEDTRPEPQDRKAPAKKAPARKGRPASRASSTSHETIKGEVVTATPGETS